MTLSGGPSGCAGCKAEAGLEVVEDMNDDGPSLKGTIAVHGLAIARGISCCPEGGNWV